MEASAPEMPAMACSPARVLVNESLPGGCHRLSLAPQEPVPPAAPGQFCMLSLDDPRFPLLPRPFSVLGWSDQGLGSAEFLVMPVGRGSGLLCSLREGQDCQLVGPFGQAFETTLPSGPLVCVAGGYGLAPFLYLAESWARHGDRRLDTLTVVFGARSAERLTLCERLLASGAGVELCTDDGSRGWPGRVDGRLAGLLQVGSTAAVLSCGPEAMMEAVADVASRAGVQTIASLETVMGCGFAVCNGCAVAVDGAADDPQQHYELACREGTLFETSRLHWKLL